MALNTLEQQALAELDLPLTRPFRLVDHLGAVRAASIIVVIALWEIFGRQVNPLFLSYPAPSAAPSCRLSSLTNFNAARSGACMCSLSA